MCVSQISIIVPVYKAEKTIKRCIDSILAQAFGDFELILIDDGSPDASGRICDEMAQKDDRIIVIHKKNGGVSSARNAGLDVAKGKYLMFCDSDDYVSPQWCQWAYEAMQKERVYLAVCGVESFSGECVGERTGVGLTKRIDRKAFVEMAESVSLYELWNKAFLAEVIRNEHIRFDERISRCEDALLILQYLQLAGENAHFCYGSPPLYYYNTETSGSLSKKYVDGYLEIEKKLLEELRAVLDGYGIIKEQYLEFYSHKAALALTGVIANSMKKNYSTIIENYRMIERIMAMQEYAIAVGYGGIDKVANGTFLWILKTSKPLIVYLYCAISKIKNRIMTYLHSK